MNDSALLTAENFMMPDEPEDDPIQAFFPTENTKLRSYRSRIANVLIGTEKAMRLSECVGNKYWLIGFHAKQVKFKNGDSGRIVTIFCEADSTREFSAISAASEYVYRALHTIAAVYKDSIGKEPIPILIRGFQTESGSYGYNLEVLND